MADLRYCCTIAHFCSASSLRHVSVFKEKISFRLNLKSYNKVIVLFLPNGIGDTLMLLPTLRRLVHVLENQGLCVVVNNRIQSELIRTAISKDLATIERHDGLPFSQLRLWIRLLHIRADWILAPLLSKKLLHKIFFITLFTKCLVPRSFITRKLLFLKPASISLESYDGHQVNYFVAFSSEVIKNIRHERVAYSELFFKSYASKSCRLNSQSLARLAIGISCGLAERHKIPSPDVFSKIVNLIYDIRPVRLLVIGSEADRNLIHEFVENLNPRIETELYINKTLELAVEAMTTCDIGIAGTTGQGHMMAAAGLPMLILAGVTNPYESGPYVERAAILKHQYKCGPCYQESFRYGCRVEKCMDTIDPLRGAQFVSQLMSDNSFGLNWMADIPKPLPKQLSTIQALHKYPRTEWIEDGNEP